MNKRGWIICLALVVLFSMLSSEVLAQNMLENVLKPFGDIEQIYNKYFPLIDMIIYLILFIGLSQATLGKSKAFQGKGSKAVFIGIGIVFAVGLALWEKSVGFNLKAFGPIAFLIFLGLMCFACYEALKGFGMSKWASIAIAFIVFYSVAMGTGIINWMTTKTPFLSLLLLAFFVVCLITIIMLIIGMFKGATGGDTLRTPYTSQPITSVNPRSPYTPPKFKPVPPKIPGTPPINPIPGAPPVNPIPGTPPINPKIPSKPIPTRPPKSFKKIKRGIKKGKKNLKRAKKKIKKGIKKGGDPNMEIKKGQILKGITSMEDLLSKLEHDVKVHDKYLNIIEGIHEKERKYGRTKVLEAYDIKEQAVESHEKELIHFELVVGVEKTKEVRKILVGLIAGAKTMFDKKELTEVLVTLNDLDVRLKKIEPWFGV